MAENQAKPHISVAGYGVPGRVVVEAFEKLNVNCSIIEQNAATVERCANHKDFMICGDARLPETLKRAGLDQATVVVVAIPDEAAALAVTRVARSLNGTCKIITRCHYQSKGFEAMAHGADEVVVSETVVAMEMIRVIQPLLAREKNAGL